MKKKFITVFMVFISMLLYGDFEKIEYMEKRFFGFKLSEKNTYEERTSALEKKILGIVSKGDPSERAEKLYTLLFLDGEEKSLATKLSDLELSLFKKNENGQELLERIEKIEIYLSKKIYNDLSFKERIKKMEDLSGILYKKDQMSTYLSDINGLEVKLVKIPKKIKKNTEFVFEIENDISGIALKGSKIYAKVEKIRKKGIIKRQEILELKFYKIINLKNKEISIDKSFEIKGNKKSLFFGKKVNLKEKIYIK